MSEVYTISQLTEAFDVTPRTLRFYEDSGLLNPRREGTRRLYSPRDRTRIKLILRGKRLGFSLNEIREILNLYDEQGQGETRQLEVLLGRIGEKQQQLFEKKRDLEAALDDLSSLRSGCEERLLQLRGKQE
ncbi:MerR family transcriptional regulator [Kiloniella sp. b19]|uniref:MerR family transcriptional regulator n=1 Tax=Kiloniella sp. GXU_MW_B19 TaxID=3141326 RepID=UPI0031E2777F